MIKTKFREVDVKQLHLINQYDYDKYKAVLLIEDYKHWLRNEQAIKDWMIASEVDYLLAGMLLLLHNEQDKSAFMLRWS